ncbi:HD domain-containing protein [Sphingobacterium sp. 1.A.4]|uniref:HD domain-containing protein n=1 Tax=Sphingobacterium sp. 1.A.4 TaxID=2044603 RepID=UPI000C0BD792|nr:hypothetical protein [Sphingobacterium sp. 1.A.4]
MINNLELHFIGLYSKYGTDTNLGKENWIELKEQYQAKGRYYHNLDHITAMLMELESVKEMLINIDLLWFAVYYHDVIYLPHSSCNEVDSANFARERLVNTNLNNKQIDQIADLILSTKKHELHQESDFNYLIDADLSILGKPWEIYLQYIKNIRKEYAMFSDTIYNSGRSKFLKHLLAEEQVFKTAWFQKKYEEQARANLARELALF